VRFAACISLVSAILAMGCSTSISPSGTLSGKTMPDTSFLDQCAFMSVDIQEGTPPIPLTEDQLPASWKSVGFTAEDVNAANDFAWNVALPNAVKVADACRNRGLPMIFLHWGYTFEDGMDLDPEIRKSMLAEHGADYSKWSGYIGQPGSEVAKALGVKKGEYVLAKTAQDAFTSSNINHVLQNLGIKRIVFVGGHTGACLGKTAKSARRLGYTTLCVRDATNNARESSREKEIAETSYDYVVTANELLDLLSRDGAYINNTKRSN
jgi:nicotinamidase-related amidase